MRQGPDADQRDHTIQSSGENRSYILRDPDNYDNNHPYRLIFGVPLEWRHDARRRRGGAARDTWSYYGLRAQANNSTIFVAPQGIGNGWGNSGGQDVTFTDDILRQIEDGLCVDTTQHVLRRASATAAR